MTLNRFYVLHCVAIPLAVVAPDHDPLLAGPQGRRDQRPDVSDGAGRLAADAAAIRARPGRDGLRFWQSQDHRVSKVPMHQDLTPGVMAGLAWYYLLAADAQRGRGGLRRLHGDGLRGGLAGRPGAAGPGGCPTGWSSPSSASTAWPSLMILGRQHPARGDRRSPTACAPWPTSWWRSPPGPTRPTSPRSRTHGHGAGAEVGPPSLDDHIPAVGLGKPINRTLWTLIWAVIAVIFQAMGIAYILGGEIMHAAVRPRRDRLRLRARPRSSSAPRSASSR